MKTLFFPLLAIFLMTFSSCVEFEDPTEYTEYQPVLMEREDFDKSVRFEPMGREISAPGKIYFYRDYIFLSETHQGIHIIDNRDPENPVKTGFLEIPGCLDMAVKNEVLYADHVSDLIAVDLTDMNNLKVLSRIPDIYPGVGPPDGKPIPEKFTGKNLPEGTVVVRWEKQNKQL